MLRNIKIENAGRVKRKTTNHDREDGRKAELN